MKFKSTESSWILFKHSTNSYFHVLMVRILLNFKKKNYKSIDIILERSSIFLKHFWKLLFFKSSWKRVYLKQSINNFHLQPTIRIPNWIINHTIQGCVGWNSTWIKEINISISLYIWNKVLTVSIYDWGWRYFKK